MFNDPQFWVFVAFIIFLLAILKPTRKILISTLDKKILEIKNRIDDAEKINSEAKKAFNDIKKRQIDVKKEIKEIKSEANKKISFIEEQTNLKLTEQINKRNELAKIKIEQMTRDANTVVQEYMTQTAITAIIDILEKKLNENEKQVLVNQSIKELNTVLKN